MSVFSSTFRRISILGLLLAVFFSVASAQHEHTQEADEYENGEKPEKEEFNASEVIIHHVVDDHSWHFWSGHNGTLFLPIIVHSSERGIEMFSSSNFYDEHHNLKSEGYNGYKLEHHKVVLANGGSTLDLSITKNVAMLFINAIVLILVFTAVAKGYKKNAGKAPSGIQSFFEPIILFVRDEIVKPNIGPKYEKFFPYLLNLFFFILFGNILGLLPGASNMTGNIAVTLVLAVLTFIITNVNGNRAYWSHILWTPGVPLPLRIVILPVEIIGIFTKPISLTVRLFVAITAGHIVILSLIALTFIFQSYSVGIASSVVALFINLIEILVAGIQAYVFTLFSSLYIGQAIADHEHDDHH
jgi:F-type H+-transporting ATPase subunit a